LGSGFIAKNLAGLMVICILEKAARPVKAWVCSGVRYHLLTAISDALSSERRPTGGTGPGETGTAQPPGGPAPGPTAARRSLLYVVKQLELAARSRLDDVLKSTGITTLQYTALTVLDRRDGLSLAQLARDSFVTPQSVAFLVANLERQELARRDRNPGNRRELIVSLTPRGRELLARYAGAVAELEEQMTSGLSAAETELLRTYLDRCRLDLLQPAPPVIP
jgi:DNA-binding MarR family transcriptional regulator